MLRISLLCVVAQLASAKVFYKETFDDDWASRWVQSGNKQDTGEAGDLVRTAGKWYADAEKDAGVQTSTDARFYTYSAAIDEPFGLEKGSDLVLQFSVKHEQQIDCGGGYIKLHPAGLDQANYNGDSEYNIMFGPDVCGSSTKKVHVIFNHDGENHLIKETIPCETDRLTHVYTLVLHPDDSFEVFIDGESKKEGKLRDLFDFELPKEIDDPEASKPEDWIDDPMMDDPEDIKPEGYDDIVEQIPDPEAEKPDDWDDEDDGEWEAPTIRNPEYKGPWRAKRIENPDYKGPWEHPQVANPDYVAVEDIATYTSNAFVGLELWQVKAGSIFDNIIVTDSLEEAEAFREETFGAMKDAEKEMFDKVEEERREKERIEREEREAELKAEEEARKAAEAEEDDVELDEGGEDDEGDDDGDDDAEESTEHDEL